MAPATRPPPASPIPVTIVTGFLGSGKTTMILSLAGQLRRDSPGYRLALLKNEFGDVAVDSQLAASGAVAGVRELLNGCICCNLVGQLGEALRELGGLTAPSAPSAPSANPANPATPPPVDTAPAGPDLTSRPPDRIVIETSGSAFPATLAFEVNRVARETGGAFTLDGVVSVVDVENWRGYEDTSYTARAQARYTDLVVFNKWEACSERRLDECLDRLGDMELDTPWVKSAKGWVDARLVFGIDGALARGLTGEEDEEGKGSQHGDHQADQHQQEHKHDHQSEVEVLSVELRAASAGAAVDADKLRAALLKKASRDEVYRIKAVLTADGGPGVRGSDDNDNAASSDNGLPTPPHERGRYILNWAFGRWTFTPMGKGVEEHESTGRSGAVLRMTMILARDEAAKWMRRIKEGGMLVLEGGQEGELVVTRIA